MRTVKGSDKIKAQQPGTETTQQPPLIPPATEKPTDGSVNEAIHESELSSASTSTAQQFGTEVIQQLTPLVLPSTEHLADDAAKKDTDQGIELKDASARNAPQSVVDTEIIIQVSNTGKVRMEPYTSTILKPGKVTRLKVKTDAERAHVLGTLEQFNALSGRKDLVVVESDEGTQV
jgi:hypothetical protein